MSILERIMEAATVGILATAGGVANYLHAVYIKRQKEFSVVMFVMNILLAFFVGNLVGSFLEQSYRYRDGIIMMAGYCTFPILSIIDTHGRLLIKKLIKKI